MTKEGPQEIGIKRRIICYPKPIWVCVWCGGNHLSQGCPNRTEEESSETIRNMPWYKKIFGC